MPNSGPRATQNIVLLVVIWKTKTSFCKHTSKTFLIAVKKFEHYDASSFSFFLFNTKSTVQYDGNVSESFTIKSGVKQGCVLAPTLFRIFFSTLLKHAFCSPTLEVKLHTRSDRRQSTVHIWNKTKVKKNTTIRYFLFVNDAALLAHSDQYM